MSRTPIWTAILDTLSGEIAAGHYGVGDRLPSEAQLAERFGVNRHTVRRALAALAEDGVVQPRQGSGVFISARPTEYAIGRRVRFRSNLNAAGRLPGRRRLSNETRQANPAELEALTLEKGAKVHVFEGVSLADGQPLALSRSVFPAGRFPDLPAILAEEESITVALARCGVADYTRASTRITAKLATAAQARHLRLREGAPILRTVSVNVDPRGVPVEYGHAWFAGDRVALSVEDQG